MKWVLLGLTALVGVAVAFVVLRPGGTGRPVVPVTAPGPAGSPGSSFVIRDAGPASPDTEAATGPKPDLDAVMQRLRTTPATPASPLPAAQPAPTPAPAPVAVPAPPEAAPRWASVSSQGTRWRLGRTGSGIVVSIDLGAGQTADVRVQPAFANLDQAAMNLRVDYLKQTILESFSGRAATYNFSRDGSVSQEP